MNDIRSVLKTAARKIEWSAFLTKAHLAAAVVAAIALMLMLADRVGAATFVPWLWVAPALAVTATLAALTLWLRQRSAEMHIALAVDERLDLREKLSTALHCERREDPFARAAIEDAVQVARDPRTRERVHRFFAIKPPRGWWISPLIVFLAIMASFLPPLNLFAEEQNDPQIVQAKLEADQTIDSVVKAIREKPELSKELSDILGELTREGADPEAFKTPDAVKRDAIKKVTDLNKKLDEIIGGEKGKTADAVEKALSQLKTPEQGAAKELLDAMAKGDFSAAKAALNELMEKVRKGELTEEEKKQAAEQLQQIAQQLEQLALQQKQMEEALKQAGLDPNLANNLKALEQALQNNPNLNEQQKQQLMQMAQAQQAAAQMCQGLGQGCMGMAQGMGGDLAQLAQGGQMMQQQLGDLEQLQMLLMEAQAAAGACQGQGAALGQGLNMQQAMQQWLQNRGGGFGGPGQGAGGKAPIAPTPTGTRTQKANVNTTEGDVIARQLFDGPQIRGESQATLIEVVNEARRGFDEALSEDQIPVKYRDAQQHYFGELEKLTEAIVEEGEESTPPAEPAPPSDKSPSSR